MLLLALAEFARQRGASPALTGNKEPEISTVERY
jgi:hypothetical protein